MLQIDSFSYHILCVFDLTSLEWRHQRQEEKNVDDYELEKKERPIHEEGVRRVNGVERVELLTFEFKANLDDIKKSCEETEIIRQQRMETLNQTKRQERIEEFVEATKKNLKKVSLKRVLSGGKMRQIQNEGHTIIRMAKYWHKEYDCV